MQSRALVGAGGVFVVFAAMAAFLPRMLQTSGASTWVLRGGLILFGLIVAGVTFLFLRSKAQKAAQQAEGAGGDDIDNAIATAQKRLAAAKLSSRTRIDRLPLVLVLGPSGSTKSSVMTHAGLEAELLAGEVTRGDAVVPTEPVNVWYAQGTVFLEAGGRVFDDEERWKRLLRHLHPSRFGAAIGRGGQAPRIAILCIPVDDFLQQGAATQIQATAKTVRERLSEASRELGIRLPVYVLFTRTDRLPYFTDFVRNLTPQEAQQVLGTTLSVTSEKGGVWAERESQRLNDAFSRLVHSLSLHRLELLPREGQENLRANTYEFPREIRRIAEPAVQFLIETFKPNQLGVNPLLRGVYFTGVRPVMVRDAGYDPGHAMGGADASGGATSVFNPAQMRQAAPQVSRSGSERKVPQWVFLNRLFRDVILRDDVAVRITGGGARVDVLRRILLGSAAIASFVVVFGIALSWANNSELIDDAKAALAEARTIGSIPGTPLETELGKLDALRLQTERVTNFKNSGRPLSYRWGLYMGDRLQPVLQQLYFERFENALWSGTREKLHTYLQALPERPDENSDFGRAQDALAAYLLTTTENRRSSGENLAATLTSFWATSDASDSSRARAERQFAYFAHHLANENPYPAQQDVELVKKTQNFLRAFGPQAYYRVLVAAASTSAPAKQYSGPSDYLRNDNVVPAAFTVEGHKQVLARIDSVDIIFARYQWIYGAPPEKPDRNALIRMYEGDYVRRWQAFIESGSIPEFASPTDASTKLRMLSELNSPIVTMLALASRETDMDSTSRIGRAFKPLRATVPPSDPRGPAANLVDYLGQLRVLSTQLGALDASANDAIKSASDASREIGIKESSVAATFISSDEAAATAGILRTFLTQPGVRTLSLVTELPKAELNGDARSFCEAFKPLAGTFPFVPGGADAQVRTVTAIFQKGEGSLWSFYTRRLEPYFNTQGVLRTPAPRGERVIPEFARFFGRAADFSNALYTDTDGPVLSFDFRPFLYPNGATEIVLEVGGGPVTFRPRANASQRITWRPDASRPVRLIVRAGNEQIHRIEGEGEWSVFKLFSGTTWREASGWQRVVWRIPSRSDSLVADIGLDVKPVLRPDYLRDLAACHPRILN